MIVDIRRLTVAEYHRMGDLGMLSPSESVELIEGQIIEKPMKGKAYSAAVSRVDRLLRNRLADRILVRLQDPVHLNEYSEPEPDIVLVKPDPLFYEDHHPEPSEIYLIIEVADTTLKRDRDFKATVYARSGITDYWILDIANRQLHIFRDPKDNQYQSETILNDDATISILAFPDVEISVAEMFSPVR